MVKIAVAGAGSGLALEIIDKLVEGQQHEVVAIVRKDPAQYPQQPGVTWVRASFEDKTELVEHFKGVEVVLNFIVVNTDPENTVGKLLIDAAVEAGVKRFAPSEWAMGQKLSDIIHKVPWYQSKLVIQKYLRDINAEKKVIEYSLFQVGQFLEYLGHPNQTTKHVPVMALGHDFENNRMVGVRGCEDEPIVFTAVGDIAAVVRAAVEYQGEWPVIGGVAGNKTSLRQVQKIVERIRGEPVTLDLAEAADVEAGILKLDMPPMSHPSIPENERHLWHAPGWTGILYATSKGAWDVSDEWNKLLPDYKFVTVEEFATKLWGQK